MGVIAKLTRSITGLGFKAIAILESLFGLLWETLLPGLGVIAMHMDARVGVQ
jgi:hypothetical protein